MKNVAIKENHLYNKTFRKGKRFLGNCVAVYVLRDYAAERLCRENPQKTVVNRLGLSVTKKVGGAVERNRAKRIIRAAYSELSPRIQKGNLIVIAAREDIAGRKSTDVLKELSYGFKKLGMMDNGYHSEKKEITEKN